MTHPFVVVKNGKEGAMLEPGDRIASRWWDGARACHVIEVATPDVPPSPEVTAEGNWGDWDCDDRGHRFAYGNQACMECNQTYEPA